MNLTFNIIQIEYAHATGQKAKGSNNMKTIRDFISTSTRVAAAGLLAAAALACGASGSDDGATGSGTGDTGDIGEPPEVYAFEGRTGEGSVHYEGQTARFVRISDLEETIRGFTVIIDTYYSYGEGEVVGELLALYQDGFASFKETLDLPVLESAATELAPEATLQEKVAGNDPEGQYKDWEQDFVGWPGASSPDDLVQRWFGSIEDLALARGSGDPALGPDGSPIPVVHVSPEGHDYRELLSKFLLGAVAYSQATDDYLDDDLPGKGLLADHADLAEGKPYTALEHHWDEAFGYFGAARDVLAYTDEEIAGKGGRDGWSGGYHDSNGDGFIDLTAEYNFSPAGYAAKRDLDSATGTDFTDAIVRAFLRGRHLLDQTDGPLSDAQLDALRAERDIIVENWEKAMAASVVHYINETLADTDALGTADYDFVTHAKHWSEMKGFALGLQFNPRKTISDADFAMLHDLLGDAPALTTNAAGGYRDDLLAARDLLGTVYGFDAADLEAW